MEKEKLHKHTFWKSALGSELLLYMTVPPESSLQCLAVKYVSVDPKTYRVRTMLTTGDTTTEYLDTRDAQAAVNEWVKYYSTRLRVEFVQHIEVDMGRMLLESRKLRQRKSLPLISASSGSDDDSGAESPRRLSWRFLFATSSTETSPRSKLSSPRVLTSAGTSPRTPRLTHAGSPRVAELKGDL